MKNINRDCKYITFSSGTLIGERFYFFSCAESMPMYVDINTGVFTHTEPPVGYHLCERSHAELVRSDANGIYKLETNGKNLVAIDRKNNTTRLISLKCDRHPWDNFAGMELYKGFAYIVTRYLPYILRVDLSSGDISHIKLPLELTEKQGDRELYVSCCCIEGHHLCLFLNGQSDVIDLDMRSNIIERYPHPKFAHECKDVVKKGDLFYFLFVNEVLCSWDRSSEELTKLFKMNHRNDYSYYGKIILLDNCLILLPALGDTITKIELQNGCVINCNNYPYDFQYIGPPSWAKYYNYCENKDGYYFPMRCSNYLLHIRKDGQLIWIKPVLPSWGEHFQKLNYYKAEYMVEPMYSLEILLEYIQEGEMERKQEDHILNVGKKIISQLLIELK